MRKNGGGYSAANSCGSTLAFTETFQLVDLGIIHPPYKSIFPKTFPSNEEIDAYKITSKSVDAKDHLFWGQNRILSSMITEYGRGICQYGDFGRYTFGYKVSRWGDFNDNDLSNYACKLIFEKYGYDTKKHGKFDEHAISGDRHRNKTERIGKKYQWIALYEVLARLSDNHKMSEGWKEDKKYFWYQGTWEPFVRNIDPTSIQQREQKTMPIRIAPKAVEGDHVLRTIALRVLPHIVRCVLHYACNGCLGSQPDRHAKDYG